MKGEWGGTTSCPHCEETSAERMVVIRQDEYVGDLATRSRLFTLSPAKQCGPPATDACPARSTGVLRAIPPPCPFCGNF